MAIPGRINLQNTPRIPNVTSRSVAFDSSGVRLVGTLYEPADSTSPRPGVIVTGAWTTVKEQMPGTYARELAARGFSALAFDFTGWGESDGEVRYKEDPRTKTADILAAADFMSSLDDVESGALAGLGLCASSGYMAAAVADHPALQSLALVAAWLHDPPMAEAVYGGPESVASLIRISREAEAADDILIAASATDERAVMYRAPYYTEADRGLIPAYDNRFHAASWEPWLTYDAQASADRLTAPTLIICSEAAALPASARAFAERLDAPLTELWLDDVDQFDFYDRRDVVEQCADAVVEHVRATT
ncbi:MAG: alpha/beta fold hydrolase [Acidobacteriota bacterium]